MIRGRLIPLGLLAILLGGGAVLARHAWMRLRPADAGVPTARVTRGDVATDIHATGDLRTPTSVSLSSPQIGGQMRILTLAATGTVVKAGDAVVTFDPSDQQYRFEDQQSQLHEAEMEIAKAEADTAAQAAKDRVDRLTAQFDVKKAELDVAGNELLGAIEARKRELTLEEARRRLAQLEEDLKSHATTNEAAMAVLVEKRNKARLTMEDARKTIEQMTLRAPIDGVVSVQNNMEGNFFFTGMQLPEYREGDMISSGRSVVQVLDVSRMEMVAHVAETDASRLVQGQRATITLDAATIGGSTPTSVKTAADAGADASANTGGATLGGTVTAIGGIRVGGGMFRQAEGPIRKIDVILAFDRPLAGGRPGLTAQIVMQSEPLKGVLFVPRQAVFDRDGKPHVYVKTGAGFTLTPIKIAARTETAVVVQDLAEGTEVALADPERKPGQTPPSGPAAPGGPARLTASR